MKIKNNSLTEPGKKEEETNMIPSFFRQLQFKYDFIQLKRLLVFAAACFLFVACVLLFS